ncbi:MAG: sel1 repeat family protein [Neisseriaceae bacterium]|nr:sel1 repeat family protein [Neisseriaceae bacterium]
MYQLACEQNDMLACQNTANYYIRTKNYPPALPFLEKMCDKNKKEGCRDLGFIHFLLLKSEDHKTNIQHSMEYLKKACDLKESMSCDLLGSIYAQKNLDGVKQNLELSQEYLNKACTLNDQKACEKVDILELYKKLKTWQENNQSSQESS